MVLINDLHTDIVMQRLLHHIVSIFHDKVYSLPHLFLVKANNHHVITIDFHPHIKQGHHEATQRTGVVVGHGLYGEQSDAQSLLTCRHNLIDEIADARISEFLAEHIIDFLLIDVMVELHEIQLGIV